MMLRERSKIVAVFVILTAGFAIAQQAAHKAKAASPAPEQAQQPDISTNLPAGEQEQFPEPQIAPPAEVPKSLPPPEPEEPKPEPKPAPKLDLQWASGPDPEPPPEPPTVPAKTPEGRKLQEQTATLLQLARELKTEIQKAGNNTLSIAALRKVDQIQKMSKSLREEMNQQGQLVPGK